MTAGTIVCSLFVLAMCAAIVLEVWRDHRAVDRVRRAAARWRKS